MTRISYQNKVLMSGLRRVVTALRGRGGMFIIETVLAVTVFVTVAGAALVGLTTIQRARATLERQAIAEILVRNQMEYIFSLDYHTTTGLYSTSNLWPSEFQVTATSTVETQTTSTDLQRVRVRILFEGEELIQLDTFRYNDGIEE